MRLSAVVSGLCVVFALSACGNKDKDKPKPTPPAPKPAPAVEPPATPAEQPHAGMPEGTASLIVAHEVEDFDKWKAAFDAHAGARKAASAVWHSVSRDVETPNKVYVHIVATDIAKVQEFMASEDLKKVMAESGVKGPPEIWLANDVAIDSPRGKLEGETFSVFGRHAVEDFDKWKVAFDADADNRKTAMGVLGGSVSRAADDANMVVFHFTVSDPAKMAEVMATDEMKKKMAAGGVKGPPELHVAKDVEMSTY